MFSHLCIRHPSVAISPFTLSVSLSICKSVYMSVRALVLMYVRLSIHAFVNLSTRQGIHLLAHVSIHTPPVYVSVCTVRLRLHVCPSVVE